jgi:hypothetical protein
MTLIDAVEQLGTLDEGSTIYASEPWTEDSTVIVAKEPNDGRLPPDAVEQKLKYFLEVFIARDFLDDWAASLPVEATLQEKCARLIQYAIKDA